MTDKGAKATKLRKEVKWFAGHMEKKLAKNDVKGGWRSCSYNYLKSRVEDEIKEMAKEATDIGATVFWDGKADEKTVNKFIGECADVANFMMMLADNARRLVERSQCDE